MSGSSWALAVLALAVGLGVGSSTFFSSLTSLAELGGDGLGACAGDATWPNPIRMAMMALISAAMAIFFKIGGLDFKMLL